MSQIGWILIGAITLAYLNTPIPKAQTIGTAPNVQREVDPTRWRHDGTQPMFWTKGNGAGFIDETVQEVAPLLS